MAALRVLVTPDRAWRVEQRPDGWWLFHLDGRILARASRNQVDAYLWAAGVAPGTLVED